MLKKFNKNIDSALHRHFVRLAHYNKWANTKLCSKLAASAAQQQPQKLNDNNTNKIVLETSPSPSPSSSLLSRNTNLYFGSISATMAHIYIADAFWFMRMTMGGDGATAAAPSSKPNYRNLNYQTISRLWVYNYDDVMQLVEEDKTRVFSMWERSICRAAAEEQNVDWSDEQQVFKLIQQNIIEQSDAWINYVNSYAAKPEQVRSSCKRCCQNLISCKMLTIIVVLLFGCCLLCLLLLCLVMV